MTTIKFTQNTSCGASGVWTSTLFVQAHQRLNVGIAIGSVEANLSTPVISTFSGIITLQRNLPNDPDGFWRDVEEWSILAADALDGASENITVNGEPESCQYRLGIKDTSADYYTNFVTVRLGTS